MWSIDRVLKKEYFYGRKYVENVHQKLVRDPFLMLVNSRKQPMQGKKLLRIKYFEKDYQKIS